MRATMFNVYIRFAASFDHSLSPPREQKRRRISRASTASAARQSIRSSMNSRVPSNTTTSRKRRDEPAVPDLCVAWVYIDTVTRKTRIQR